MFKNIKTIVAILFVSILTVGCTNTPVVHEETVMYRTRLQVVVPPSHLIENCPVPIPPERSTYATMTTQQKEEALTKYAMSLLTSVSLCNTNIDKIRDWSERQKSLYGQAPVGSR
jgi:hypothetical protein